MHCAGRHRKCDFELNISGLCDIPYDNVNDDGDDDDAKNENENDNYNGKYKCTSTILIVRWRGAWRRRHRVYFGRVTIWKRTEKYV